MDINRRVSSSRFLADSNVVAMPPSFRLMAPKNGGDGGGGGECVGGGVALELEVTVLSAESLSLPPSYSPLPRRLRPYVTVSSSAAAPGAGCSASTAVAAGRSGAGEHSWDDTLVVPVGAAFLDGRDDVHVSVFSEPSCRLLVGATPLGWCRVTAADVLDGLRPPRALRRLSYSLRCPPSSSASSGPRGVVHLAVRVLGADVDADADADAPPRALPPQQPGWCRVAMGIPVSGASPAAAAAVVGMPTPWAWR